MEWDEEDPGVGVMTGVADFATACTRMASHGAQARDAMWQVAQRTAASQQSMAVDAWSSSIGRRVAEWDQIIATAHRWSNAAQDYADAVASIQHRATATHTERDAARTTLWFIDNNREMVSHDPNTAWREAQARESWNQANWMLERLVSERRGADLAFTAALASRPALPVAHPAMAVALRALLGGDLPMGSWWSLQSILEMWRLVASRQIGHDGWLSYAFSQDSRSGSGSAEAWSRADFSWFGGLTESYLEARAQAHASANADAGFEATWTSLDAFARAEAEASADASVGWGADVGDGWLSNQSALGAHANAEARANSAFQAGPDGSTLSLGAGASADVAVDFVTSTQWGHGAGESSTGLSAFAGATANVNLDQSFTPSQAGQHVSAGLEANAGLEARQDFDFGPFDVGGGLNASVGVGASYSGGWDFGYERVGADLDLGFALGGGLGADVYIGFSPREMVTGIQSWFD